MHIFEIVFENFNSLENSNKIKIIEEYLNNKEIVDLFDQFIIKYSEYSYNIELIKNIFKIVLKYLHLLDKSNQSLIIMTYFISCVRYINIHYIIDKEFIQLIKDEDTSTTESITKLIELKSIIKDSINIKLAKPPDIERDEVLNSAIEPLNLFDTIQIKLINYLMTCKPDIYEI
jgi:hypothetical protein